MDATSRKLADTERREREQGWAATDFSLTMAFQPILDMSEGTIFAHEALVRGPNGETADHVLSQVGPDSQASFDQLCRTRAIELATSLQIRENISINFEPIKGNNLERGIIRTLKAAETFRFPTDRLLFEIVDHEDRRDIDFLVSVIQAYRANNMATALDNFGNGSAQLNDLERLCPDFIKLDRQLTHRVHGNRVRQIFIKSVVELCNDINCKVIAQGVESPEDLEGLLALGIQYFQGYLLAKPSFEAVASIELPTPEA